MRRARVLHQLREHGVAVHKSVTAIEIGQDNVSFELEVLP